MTGIPAPQVNQDRRILLLRVLFIALLPVLVIAQPAIGQRTFTAEMFETAGVLLVFAAVLGRFWSILYIGDSKNATVMQDGPYSLCRHPLYLFSTIGVFGLGLMMGMITIAVLLALVAWLVLMATARKEEAFLRGEFGPAYDEYAKVVPQIIPRSLAYSSPEKTTFSAGTLSRHALDALAFLLVLPLEELLEWVKLTGIFPSVIIY